MPNVAAATRFADFLVSAGLPGGAGELPDGDRPGLPAGRVPGASRSTAAAADRRAGRRRSTLGGVAPTGSPAAAPIAGLPIQLQQSTDDGATWTNVGAPGQRRRRRARSASTHDDRPHDELPVRRRPRIAASATTSSARRTQDLGVVSAPAPKPEPDAGPTPKHERSRRRRPHQGAAPDELRLTGKRVSLHVSEASTVKVVIQRRVRRGDEAPLRTKVDRPLKPSRARTLSGQHKALGDGRYRFRITATDAAGNRRTADAEVRRR